MKLFDMTGAPNPRRVRVFLFEKGIDVEKQEIDIMGGENLKSEYLSINPRGVLPTLQLDDGTIIDEASAICRYFEATHPTPALYGSDPKSKGLIESWIRQVELDAFAPTADVLRNTNPAFENRSIAGTDNTPQIKALADRGTDRVLKFYARLDNHLHNNQFLVGDDFSAADITAMCMIDFAEYVGIAPPDNLTKLAEWRERVSSRPSSQA